MTWMLIDVAQIVPVTEAEGPGRRFALWFQGCPLRCPGCCNPEMLSFTHDKQRSIADVLGELDLACAQGIEGITLLGGEPLAHAPAALALARAAHSRELSVMIFTGYTLQEARDLPEPAVADLLAETDILVDGPYRREESERRRRWIGSRNQQVHFLSERCDRNDPRWLLPNTIEVRFNDGQLTVNGFPSQTALELWHRPRVSS